MAEITRLGVFFFSKLRAVLMALLGVKAGILHRQARILLVGIGFTGLLILPSVARAQLTMMKPSAALQQLERFMGTWVRSSDETQTGGPTPKYAKMHVDWGPGEFWMTWNVEIQFSTGETIHGRRQITWNSEKNHYSSSWIDSQSAHIITSSAIWKDGAFEIEGDPFTWSDGHTYRFRTQYAFVSADSMHETGWRSVDAGEFKQHSEAIWSREE